MAVGTAPRAGGSARVPGGRSRLPHRFLGGVAVATTVLLALLCALNPIAVTDFWWQAKTGELIVQHGRIPTTDPFSWTAQGAPWLVHEWLIEVLFAWMARALPREALLLWKSGLAGVVCGLVLLRAFRRSGSVAASCAAAALAALTVGNYADLRPQMATFVLLVLLLAMLDAYRDGPDRLRRRLQWAFPALFAVWANLHGGVLVGLAVFAAWTAGECLGTCLQAYGARGNGRLVFTLGMCAVAVLANPNGIHLYAYPAQVLAHPRVTGYITEWFSPDFHDRDLRAFQVLLLGTLGLAAPAAAASRAALRPGELVALLALASAALTYQRNTAVFALSAAPAFACYLAVVCRAAAGRLPVSARGGEYGPLVAGTAGVACLLGLAWAVRPPGSPGSWAEWAIGWRLFPHAAADRLLRGEFPGRLYNDYSWGGYLIWRLYPHRRVFIDGRAEVYYAGGVFDDEMLIHWTQPGWHEALDRRGVQVVLTRRTGLLAGALRGHSGWREAFSGPVEVIYVRRALPLLARLSPHPRPFPSWYISYRGGAGEGSPGADTWGALAGEDPGTAGTPPEHSPGRGHALQNTDQ